MRLLFVVKPRAGRGSSLKIWQRVGTLVARTPQCEAVIPTCSAETRRITAEAVKAGVNRVIVVGGDGTLAAVAGELAFSDTALGVIPAGTANDFCRNARIPHIPQDALEIALHAEVQRIDLGQASGGPYFLNVAGIGFDAEVAAISARLPAGLGGTLPYLLGAMSTLFRYRTVEMEVTVDDRMFSGPSMLIAIANGRFYGGGMQIAPLARPDDGQLDVCIAGSLGRAELAMLLRQVYSGTHVYHPKILTAKGRHVRVQAKGRVRAHVDGEPLDWDPLDFQVRAKALAVAIPPL